MAFVDRVQLEALIKGIEEESAPRADAPGLAGSLARTVPIARAFYTWQADEIARGTSPEDLSRAGAYAFGSMIGALARQVSEPGHVVGIARHLFECAEANAIETIRNNKGAATVHQGPDQ